MPITKRMPHLACHVRTTVLAASIALALAGCTVPVVKSSFDAPPNFAAAQPSDTDPEAAWWEGFGDPVLGDLVRRAARENRDVRIAAERVRAARAGETVSRSALFPSIGASLGATDHNSQYESAKKQLSPDMKSASGGLDVSWEIDLAGRLRAGARAAQADTMAAEDSARGVRLLVLTDVASNYFTLVGALRQLGTTREISAAQDETLRLVKARERAGLANAFDVERAETDASRTRAAIPPLETLVKVSRHRIAVLIGDQAFNASAIAPWTGEASIPAPHAGQPAGLLERRPDILAAKAQLDAANARRQQAMAEWFPRLFLSAMFGGQGVDVNGASLGSARFTSAAALLTMPIFNAGRTRATNEIAASGQDEALLRYEDTMVRALEDVENALVGLEAEGRRSQDMQRASRSADAALGRARSLYSRGQIDLLPLLDAQRAQLTVKLAANDSHTQLLLDSVQLYKALGGGWQPFETVKEPS
jgi:NodT family efflux transporter outer membrane factor (OMF) lipoprotein